MTAATGPKVSSSKAGSSSAGRRRARSAGRSSPCRAGARRRAAAARPAPTDALTCSSRSSRRSARASGPTCGLAVQRVADRELRIAATKSRSNCSATASSHDEALGGDAALAVVDDARRRPRSSTACVEIGVGRTMNGSLPPSSSTVFLSALPAPLGDARCRPARCRSASRPRRAVSAITRRDLRASRSAASGRRPPAKPARGTPPRSPARTAGRSRRA